MRLPSRRHARARAAFAIVLAAAGIAALFSTAAASSAAKPLQSSMVALEEDIAPALDTDSAQAAQPQLQEILDNVMDPLVAYPTKLHNGVLIPDYTVSQTGFAPRLAASYTMSKDGKTFIFHLRHGVMSCAGNELTSADVVYSFARAKSVSGGAAVGWFLGSVASLFSTAPIQKNATPADKELHGEVVALNKWTVAFHLLNRNELFPRVLTILGSTSGTPRP